MMPRERLTSKEAQVATLVWQGLPIAKLASYWEPPNRSSKTIQPSVVPSVYGIAGENCCKRFSLLAATTRKNPQ